MLKSREQALLDEWGLGNEDTSQTYTFQKTDFHPGLPTADHVYHNGKITLWINAGTKDIIALTLSDQHNQFPVKYTSAYYDTPDKASADSLINGSILSAIGLLFLFIGTLWWKMPWTKFARMPAPVSVSQQKQS